MVWIAEWTIATRRDLRLPGCHPATDWVRHHVHSEEYLLVTVLRLVRSILTIQISIDD